MAFTIPTTEPISIVAGDTVEWTKNVASYPATDGWTLSYSLHKLGGTDAPITFSASPVGAGYSVSVAGTTTSAWAAGNYVLTAYVTKSGERHTVGSSDLSIQSDPAAAFGATHATRTLALIEAAIEGRVPRNLQEYSINGQQIAKIPLLQLVQLRSVYADLVANEKAQARLNAGMSNSRTRWARFRSIS